MPKDWCLPALPTWESLPSHLAVDWLLTYLEPSVNQKWSECVSQLQCFFQSLTWICHLCVPRDFGLDLLEKRPRWLASSLQMSLKSKVIENTTVIHFSHSLTFHLLCFVIKSSSQIIQKEDLCISPGKVSGIKKLWAFISYKVWFLFFFLFFGGENWTGKLK